MKRRILTALVFFVISVFGVSAQDKALRFVYIAHDENTVTQKLIYILKEYYIDVLNYPDFRSAVFYLANGSYPVIVRVNTVNENPKDFDIIVDELQSKRSHDVDVETDLERIPQIFNEIETTADGVPAFSSVEWDWYINSTFWSLGYNESVIAALSWIMEMPDFVEKGSLDLKFYSDEKDILPVDEAHPFGEKGLFGEISFIPLIY